MARMERPSQSTFYARINYLTSKEIQPISAEKKEITKAVFGSTAAQQKETMKD